MANVYSAQVVSPFRNGTDILAIEITAAANKTIKIRRIRISRGLGTETVVADYLTKVKLITESVAGTGGTTYTPTEMDDSCPNSTSTVKTTALVGTIDKTIDILSLHSNHDYIWNARDEADKIVTKPGGIFAISINPAADV